MEKEKVLEALRQWCVDAYNDVTEEFNCEIDYDTEEHYIKATINTFLEYYEKLK